VPALERDARTSPSDPALLLTQTIAGGVIAPEVIAALLVASPEVESEVRAALPAEYCEITSTGEPETALLVIDHVAPDLVMIEAGSLREGAESLVQGLRGERRAIVALLPELASETDAQLGLAWADAVLRLPLPRAGLLERLQRLAGRGARPQSALERLQAGTIDEIARSIGDCHAGVCGGGVALDCNDAVTLPCHVPTCDESTDTCRQEAGHQGEGCDDGLDCTQDEVCDNGECSATFCSNTCQPGFDCNIDCHGVDQCDSTCDQSGGCAVNCTGTDQCTFNCKSTQCGLTCNGTQSCNVKCSGNATCAIDCRSSDPTACSAVVCENSSCTLTCDPGDSCGFKDCKDQATCIDGTIVCGHACPMLPP
jgi:hypothetical protein